MAKSTDLQQALALRKQNPNITTADAVAQVRASAVTPTPPTTPPLAPTQTMKGVNGETFQVAPTNPNTGLTQPTQPVPPVQAKVTPPETTVASAVTPAPTPEVAPTPLDKTAEIKAKNEAQMALNKQKSELAIQDRKQAEADAKLASTPTDEKGVLNAFMTGASVPKQNTQAFRNAEFKYNNFKKFSTMTPTQLLDNMKMGEIGTETATLLAQNPNYIKAKEEFDKFQKSQSINNMMKSVVGGATGKTEGVDYYGKAQSDVAKKLGVNETNAEAFARIVGGNELVQTLTKTVSDTAKQLNTLNTERNAVYADLKKQYPDMSASAIMTLMGTRTKETTDQINALNSTLTLTQADLKDAMTMAQAEYGATQADIALQADIAKEQRTIDNALALNQAEFDQKIAQQAQMMGTPELAIPNTIKKYEDQGIMGTLSAKDHIDAFREQEAKYGTTLGEYISQMQKDFQAKDSYKAKFTETSKPTIKNFGTSDKPDYRQYNTKTGKWETISGVGGGTTGTPIKPTGNIVPVTAGNKTVRLDQSGATGFANAISQLEQGGISIVVGEGARDQTATIKSMAERYGIPFNASNPSETAKKLRSAGHQVADPGKSNHESGMAIDVYANGKFDPVTPEQERILNANGWYSAGIPGDAGHFEYRGGGKGTQGEDIKMQALPLYRAYMEDNKLPSKDALSGLGMTSDQFVNNASVGYDQFLKSKSQEINSTYPTLQIEFTPSYASLSPTQREKLNESMTKIGDIDMRLEKLKKLFNDNGTEVLPTKAKKEMQSLKQQIILKAKEVENLGVLNGPDLGILESLIPETTGIMSGLFSFDDNTNTTLNSIQSNYRSDAKTKGINYGAKISFKGNEAQSQESQTNTGAVQISPEAQSIENEWLKNNK